MKNEIIIICGVSGSGKSTIGRLLATHISILFFDGDDYHSQANIDKISSGQALDDQDRTPWLEKLNQLAQEEVQKKRAIIACSVLKEKYRETLTTDLDPSYIKWIFLEGYYELLSKRLTTRKNHFFDPKLLRDQFYTLEVPHYEIHIDIVNGKKTIITEILTVINKPKSDFGLIGLGVMGKNLALNMLNNQVNLAVYNRHITSIEQNIASGFNKEHKQYSNLETYDELNEFLNGLNTPKKIMLMVSAGPAVDAVIDSLVPHLSQGDIIIDRGNSHYNDTQRRVDLLNQKGIHFVGCGVSGGEEGVLKGPSIMPGGSEKGYVAIKKVLESIAAKDELGNACCTYIRGEGVGHFVKMIYNVIEYTEMQLIAETYHHFRYVTDLLEDKIAQLFDTWNQGELKSYLLEISAQIPTVKEGEQYLVDLILDVAEQKGTGGWSTTAALDLGVPLSTISEAVMARHLSGRKTERKKASAVYTNIKRSENKTSKEEQVSKLKSAYTCARVTNHSIGLDVIQKMSQKRSWNIDLSELTRVWTNGCIIRSQLMSELIDIYKTEPNTHLLLKKSIVDQVSLDIPNLVETVSRALASGNAIPVFFAALNYFNGFTSEQLSTNMIQAQRDFFGAHTYKRNYRDSNEIFHTDWLNTIS